MGTPDETRPADAEFRWSHSVLVASVLILVALSGVLLPGLQSQRAESRDARRLADLRVLEEAVRRYARDQGRLPRPAPESGHAGWDTTLDGVFLPELGEQGYLPAPLLDPVNDEHHHYRYFVYPAGSEGFADESFVLGVRSFESETYRRQRKGLVGTGRDWGQELDFVITGTR